MARIASCCLNLSLPPTNASTSSSRTQVTPCKRNDNEATWRSQCVVGVACMTIGLGMGNLLVTNQSHAITLTEVSAVSEQRQEKWSEKRSCPPWTINSFELTVPENLPRAHSRRGWEPAGLGTGSSSSSGSGHHIKKLDSSSSSSVKVIARANPKCFSM